MMIEGGQSVDNTRDQEYHIKDVLARPWILVLFFGGISIIIGTAIRLTRISITSEIESAHRLEQNSCKSCLKTWSFLEGWKSFWKKLPRRVWNFYIESFLVPCYRNEWGKFKTWSYRAPPRPPPKPHVSHADSHSEEGVTRDSRKRSSRIPQPIPHCHMDCERIRINVGGVRFETQLRTLERYPETLLGNPEKRLPYFNPDTQEYYFDRCRATFEVILYFYQSGGRFKRPDNVPADILLEDAHFFQLGAAVVDQYRLDEGLSSQTVRHEILPQSLLSRKIWLLFDFPESSPQAGFVTFLSTFALFLSIGMLCLESMELFALEAEYGVNPDGTVMVISYNSMDILDPFIFTEAACNVWFIFEYLGRLCSCPIVGQYVKDGLNLIDLIAIVPFTLTIIVPMIEVLITGSRNQEENLIADDTNNSFDYLDILRIIRIVRVFRIFKLSRHFKGLKILGQTMKASLNELMLLIFFIILGVILFSSTMYFAELDDANSQFDSISSGFWWALITLTTVGYGDIVPITPLGKVVGSLCAVAGVLVIALPVPVIVSNFNYFYHQAIDEKDLRWININHVSSCPFRPSGSTADNEKSKENISQLQDNRSKGPAESKLNSESPKDRPPDNKQKPKGPKDTTENKKKPEEKLSSAKNKNKDIP